ncbi:MAG: methyltransferase domain-containing protein [Actinobacteria bacterium]|nr:methyltransferase domain-containing protein [Actinomycetota bacterium]
MMYRMPSATGTVPTGVAAILAPVVERLDARAEGGRGFALRFWDGSELPATPGWVDPPAVVFRTPDALVRMIRRPGELGLSRAYVAGELEAEGDLEDTFARVKVWRYAPFERGDLIPALRAVRRLGILRRPEPEPPACEARLSGRAHSHKRDSDAIQHHYDVSNEFYQRMLGPTMVYSCAYFDGPQDTLEAAQTRKLDVICRKLGLNDTHRLLDIGCGWGSMLIHAAREYGARAVGVTLSEAQAELARERIREAGVEDLCEVRIQDYRDIADGPFDRISSIGMFEHVGEANLPLYLEKARSLLADDGLFLNHGIVRAQGAAMDPNTFAMRYVFPDGYLHTQGAVISAFEAAGFELRDDESLRPHYARTLRCWAENHDAHRELAVAEIGAERERVWRLHNVGAALGFDCGDLSLHQALLAPIGGGPEFETRIPDYRS